METFLIILHYYISLNIKIFFSILNLFDSIKSSVIIILFEFKSILMFKNLFIVLYLHIYKIDMKILKSIGKINKQFLNSFEIKIYMKDLIF